MEALWRGTVWHRRRIAVTANVRLRAYSQSTNFNASINSSKIKGNRSSNSKRGISANTKLESLIKNPSDTLRTKGNAALWVAAALRNEPGSALTASGALAVTSGARTGRSPADKRIVVSANSSITENSNSNSNPSVDWGRVNIPLSAAAYASQRSRALRFLADAPSRYIVDGFAGCHPDHRLKIRVICTRAYHALFMQNMLVRPTAEELENFGTPDFTIYNAGEYDADPQVEGVSSNTLIALNFAEKEVVILGSEYAGEMKKGVFTIMHYLMPLKGILSLHSSANEGKYSGDVSLFFGLSGTGKTTLSTDPNRLLIGDDEHCWSDDGIFNIEGGCYAKAIDLSPEKEPEIFNAIKFGAIVENVILDENSNIDFKDTSITENTRACYPIDFIPNSKIPGIAGHPKNIIFLTCDAYGVLPPVSALTTVQAMYHFAAGYTCKVAGTEQGITAPSATFSACFGAPFLVHPPALYSRMLAEKLEESGAKVWLLNTGWIGGPAGVGQRIPLQYSRAIVDAIHSGQLASSITRKSATLPLFDLKIPVDSISGVPSSIFNPVNAWRDAGKSPDAFDTALQELKTLFDQVLKDTVQ